ncbi:MAG: aminoacyl-tRNA hydrolase [Leptospira sp.]|jgi:peptidyl-tRNA hydrolase, PTH1 family|nr:aminoacyl-tRNA hydrolase [Leptospira sp.]NCS95188.1 aminoacyl-tRNA hydrolase [Leptospira sp.]
MNLLIAGLGNPGTKYEKTRHNIGFMILDEYCQDEKQDWTTNKNSLYAKFNYKEATIHLLKPQEYMNLSGKEVSRIARMLKIPSSHILVVHDEIDIPFAKIKNKIGGGTAGHNGLGDIVERLGNSSFHRLRFGVGKPIHPGMDVADFVLQKFSTEEMTLLPKLMKDSIQRIQDWIREQIKIASKL